MAFPAPGEIQARRQELRRKIDDGEQAKEELAQIDEWLRLGSELFSPGAKTVGVTFRRAGRIHRLAAHAEKVLRGQGKRHVTRLMEEMRLDGWVSTGDDRKDMKNVHACLSGNKRFVNLGRNVWDLATSSSPANSDIEAAS
jgi:hypothetical protein